LRAKHTRPVYFSFLNIKLQRKKSGPTKKLAHQPIPKYYILSF
jgi:hypothetical protein